MTWQEALHRLIDPLDSVAAACTWVPPAGEGVCATCHAAATSGHERCFSCFRTMAQVSASVPDVVPISLYRTGDDLWHKLRHYKDGRNAAERRRLRRDLARLLSRFLRHHLACVAAGAPTGWRITCVPPTRRRSLRPFQPRPVESLIRRSWWLRRRYLRTLSTRHAPEHRQSSDAAFAVTTEVRGLELILVDDTYTTGASVQSAASALQLAGATVLAVVVIGRVVNPDANPAEARLWAAARRQPFRLQECCRDALLAPDLAAFPLPWSP